MMVKWAPCFATILCLCLVERVRNSGFFDKSQDTNLVWQVGNADTINRRRRDRHDDGWLEEGQRRGNNHVETEIRSYLPVFALWHIIYLFVYLFISI